MHNTDIYRLVKYYNENINSIKESVNMRNINYNFEFVNNLIDKLKELNNNFNLICRKRNEGMKNFNSVKEREKTIKTTKRDLGIKISETEKELRIRLLELPNIIHNSVKKENIIINTNEGNKKNIFGIKFTDYIDKHCKRYNGKTLFLDVTLSKMKQDLINYFINKNVQDGFQFISVPIIITRHDMEISGQLPKFEENLFCIKQENRHNNDIFLIPTSEVILCKYLNYVNLEESCHKFCAYTPCFRNEQNNTSKINKPLLRQLHFEKVETFILCKIEDENKHLELCLNRVKEILNYFGFQYKIIQVGATDMSATAYLQYDIEVYLPQSGIWIELVSCSSCHNYQLYRNANFKLEQCQKFITINCSCFPIERFITCLIEYYYCDNKNSFIINFSNIK